MVSWDWVSWKADAHMPEPLWAERHGDTPLSRRRTGPPKAHATKVRYGLDAAGQIRVVQSVYAPSEDELIVQVEALRWPTATGDWILVATSTRSPGTAGAFLELVGWLRRARYDREQVLAVDFWRQFEETSAPRESYRHDANGAVIGIDITRFKGGTTLRQSYEVSRGAAAQVEKVVSISPAGERIVYRRAVAGAAARAKRTVFDELIDRVRRWSDRHVEASADDVVAVLLVYGAGERQPFPPSLALVTAADLERRRRQEPRAPLSDVLLPAEVRIFDTDPSEFAQPSALGEACALLNAAWVSAPGENWATCAG